MNRFRKAWLVFCGEVEHLVERVEVPTYVVGEASLVKLYRVAVSEDKKLKKEAKVTRRANKELTIEPDIRGSFYDPSLVGYVRYSETPHTYLYYASCEAANLAHPNASVRQLDAIQVGDKYMPLESLKLVEAASKPKVAKGRK